MKTSEQNIKGKKITANDQRNKCIKTNTVAKIDRTDPSPQCNCYLCQVQIAFITNGGDYPRHTIACSYIIFRKKHTIQEIMADKVWSRKKTSEKPRQELLIHCQPTLCDAEYPLKCFYSSSHYNV